MSIWSRTLTPEEKRVIDFLLRSKDSPVRTLVCELIERIETCEQNRMTALIAGRFPDLTAVVACEARVEAYRYAIMRAIEHQNAADFAKGATERRPG